MTILLKKSRKRSKELFSKDVSEIIVPYTADQLTALLTDSDAWQIATIGFIREIKHYLPAHPILQFLKIHPFLFPEVWKTEPLPSLASLVFADGSSHGVAAFVIDERSAFQSNESSAQRVEFRRCLKFCLLKPSIFRLIPAILHVCFSILKLLCFLPHRLQCFHCCKHYSS